MDEALETRQADAAAPLSPQTETNELTPNDATRTIATAPSAEANETLTSQANETEHEGPSSPKGASPPETDGIEETAPDEAQSVIADTETAPNQTHPIIVEPEEDRTRAVTLARRLIDLDGFKRSEVAAELSKKTPFGVAVAEEYLRHFDFAGATLDVALRDFVKRFSLTGETYERERVIEHFSRRFYACNPGISETVGSFESLHTLACSLLLLNTDLHDQNMIGARMSLNDFVANLAGMRDGSDYPRDYLKIVYQGIKTHPLRWAIDDETEMSSNDRLDVTPRRRAMPRSPKKSVVSLNDVEGQKVVTLAGTFVEVELDVDAEVFKAGRIARKKVMETVGKRTTLGRRAWHEYDAVLKGFLFYFHRLRRKQTHHQDDDVASAIPVTHAYATVALDYTKRHGVFRFTTSDWQEYLLDAGDAGQMHEWIQAINLASGRFSSPPLPAPIGSSRHFQRPVLPRHPCATAPEEQLERHRSKARLLEDELIEHRAAKPYGKVARRDGVQWSEKRRYLEYETRRYKGYVRALETSMGVTGSEDDPYIDSPFRSDSGSSLTSSLSGGRRRGSSAGDDGAAGGGGVEPAAGSKVMMKRSTSDRSSYKKAVSKFPGRRTTNRK